MKRLLMTTLFLLASTCFFAQTGIKSIKKDVRGNVTFYDFAKQKKLEERFALPQQWLKKTFKLSTTEKYQEQPVYYRRNNLHHKLYNQYYNDIPIDGGSYVFHYKGDSLTFAHGHYIPVNDINTTPDYTEKQAVQIFALHEGVPVSSIDDYKAELIIKEFADEDDTVKARLVYKVYFPTSSNIGYVDAHTGLVIHTESAIVCLHSTGTFHTRYNGVCQGITHYYNNAYHLVDSTRGAIIHTWDANNQYYGDISELSDSDNIWTIEEHHTDNMDMALDVHWSLQRIYDHLYNHHHINSFDDNGKKITAYVRALYPSITGGHFNVSKDNAYWNHTDYSLYFCEGENRFNPIASLDAIAHEFGHGITDFNIEWNAQMGFLNEGLSDIWAAIFEHAVYPSSPDIWTIGEQIMKDGHSYIRNIKTPNDSHASIPMADTYNVGLYHTSEEEGVYARGGIFSHWFYLLVNGGNGINGLNKSYSVTGVGFDKAEELIVHAVYNKYLNKTTSYEEVRTAMICAAEDLEDLELVAQVANAWDAVGVFPEPEIKEIVGPSSFYNVETFQIENIPNNYSTTWSIDNNDAFSLTPSGSSCVVTYKSSYPENMATANLIATIKNGNNQIYHILKKDIVGYDANLSVSGSQLDITDPSGRIKLKGFYIQTSTAGDSIVLADSITIYSGSDVSLYSKRFKGMNITFGGFPQPIDVKHYESEVSFLPYSTSVDYPMILRAYGENGYNNFEIHFTITNVDTGSPELLLALSLKQDYLIVTLLNAAGDPLPSGDYQQKPWNLRINNAQTGLSVYSERVIGDSHKICISSFQPGTYVVTALYEGNIYSKKFNKTK